ncbi:MAG: hypothetical protein KGD64_00845 [Candidatus Heimdallarchaeota archaeon]|nr:hypothetical protein [Candidatus Heimdallarchaeota archaeon]
MIVEISRTSFFQVTLLLCLFIVFSPSLISSNQGINLKIGDVIVYDVLEASNTSNLFFGAWPPGDYLGNWTVNQNERIVYELTNVTTSEIEGGLDLGNYSFLEVRSIDIASALVLSIYPWNGGFFANATNWNGIMEMVENTNTSVTIVEGLEHNVNNEAQLFNVYIFSTENYYGQDSLFCYDIDSGVLLSAYSSFGEYYLNISLSSTNFEMQNTNIISYYFLSYVSLFLIIALIIRKRSQKL